jgi:hypothetical protein
MNEKYEYIKRIIIGIICIITGIYAIVVTPPSMDIIMSIFGLIGLFCILITIIGIFLIGIGLFYVFTKDEVIINKFEKLAQLQKEMHALNLHQKAKEKEKSFKLAFPYFCDNCRMFSYTFLEICENCGAKNTTRKATKGDYEVYLKINQ